MINVITARCRLQTQGDGMGDSICHRRAARNQGTYVGTDDRRDDGGWDDDAADSQSCNHQ